MKKVLFIGSLKTEHIRRFLKRLALCNMEGVEIHFFNLNFNFDYYFEDGVDVVVHSLRIGSFAKYLLNLPIIGPLSRIFCDILFLLKLSRKEKFTIISFLSIPIETFLFVRVAHFRHTKTLLAALGSDVLRTSRFKSWLQSIAFKETDFVAANNRYRFSQWLTNRFNIPEYKCRFLVFGSDSITSIIEMRQKYSKIFCQEQLGLPPSTYNIVCGYNASLNQRQELMIESLVLNKNLLPKDYLIIVPLTYGLDKDILIDKLKKKCEKASLNVVFLTEYLSSQQVTYLRLITDLFIHIQATDAYNASLQEFMLAGAQCINGRWLKYDTLEEHGKVFHVIDEPEDLSIFLRDWFSGKIEPIQLPIECEDEIRQGKDWKIVLSYWKDFLSEQ